jgi:hypothetical protein
MHPVIVKDKNLSKSSHFQLPVTKLILPDTFAFIHLTDRVGVFCLKPIGFDKNMNFS